MQEDQFAEVVNKIRSQHPAFAVDAYFFVREALDFTSKKLKKPAEGVQRHVSGHELLDGIRDFTLREFGPMAFTVLNSWNLTRTDDFGEIVFQLVEAGVLGKTPEDKKEDFSAHYDFHKAFVEPFLPRRVTSPISGKGGETAPRRRATRKKNP
jgi:uncharacterized repeat protein (TIGR04138 family)